MTIGSPTPVSQDGRPDNLALRIYLDANVWIGVLSSAAHGRSGTAAARLGEMIARMSTGSVGLQLVVSADLLDTLRRVLPGQGLKQSEAENFIESLVDLARSGPDHLDPVFVLSGREQFAMRDQEDARILAACFAARGHLLVTNNLKDFWIEDCLRLDTRMANYSDGVQQQLYALFHTRADGVTVAVMHPVDAADCLENGVWPSASAVGERYPKPDG